MKVGLSKPFTTGISNLRISSENVFLSFILIKSLSSVSTLLAIIEITSTSFSLKVLR
jgi:hypothetical protein